jgi:hypothetical protein
VRATLARARELLAHPVAALVCDIDGTLARDTARRHLRPKADPHCLAGVEAEAIRRYMAPELVDRDRPVPMADHFVGALGAPRLLVVTARWEPLRSTTASWLARHYPELRYRELLMRQAWDARPSVVVKLDRVLQHCRTGVWLDDDPEMLAVAERHGFVGLKAPDIFDSWCEVNQHAAV